MQKLPWTQLSWQKARGKKRGEYQHVVNDKERIEEPNLEGPKKTNDSRDTILG